MKPATFLGAILVVAAIALAVAGVAGMPHRTCSGDFHFVQSHCGTLLRGYLFLFAGFGVGAIGAVVLIRAGRRR